MAGGGDRVRTMARSYAYLVLGLTSAGLALKAIQMINPHQPEQGQTDRTLTFTEVMLLLGVGQVVMAMMATSRWRYANSVAIGVSYGLIFGVIIALRRRV